MASAIPLSRVFTCDVDLIAGSNTNVSPIPSSDCAALLGLAELMDEASICRTNEKMLRLRRQR